jgi:hypothetical protein
MPEAAEVWREHQHAQFPASCLPLSIDGVRLVKIDAVAGAILTASLRSDGIVRRVEDPKRRDLEHQHGLMLRALREVSLDPEGKAYFERLAALADRVLKG